MYDRLMSESFGLVLYAILFVFFIFLQNDTWDFFTSDLEAEEVKV